MAQKIIKIPTFTFIAKDDEGNVLTGTGGNNPLVNIQFARYEEVELEGGGTEYQWVDYNITRETDPEGKVYISMLDFPQPNLVNFSISYNDDSYNGYIDFSAPNVEMNGMGGVVDLKQDVNESGEDHLDGEIDVTFEFVSSRGNLYKGKATLIFDIYGSFGPDYYSGVSTTETTGSFNMNTGNFSASGILLKSTMFGVIPGEFSLNGTVTEDETPGSPWDATLSFSASGGGDSSSGSGSGSAIISVNNFEGPYNYNIESGCIELYKEDDFELMEKYPVSDFCLKNDISVTKDWDIGRPKTDDPSENEYFSFGGNLYGNNHKISNLNTPLFFSIEGDLSETENYNNIKNITFENCNVSELPADTTLPDELLYATYSGGVLARQAKYAVKLENIKIKESSIKSVFVGSMIGHIMSSVVKIDKISGVKNILTADMQDMLPMGFASGLIGMGFNAQIEISNSYFRGDINFINVPDPSNMEMAVGAGLSFTSTNLEIDNSYADNTFALDKNEVIFLGTGAGNNNTTVNNCYYNYTKAISNLSEANYLDQDTDLSSPRTASQMSIADTIYDKGNKPGAGPNWEYYWQVVGPTNGTNNWEEDNHYLVDDIVLYNSVEYKCIREHFSSSDATYLNWDFEEVWGIEKTTNDGFPYLGIGNFDLIFLNGLSESEGFLAIEWNLSIKASLQLLINLKIDNRFPIVRTDSAKRFNDGREMDVGGTVIDIGPYAEELKNGKVKGFTQFKPDYMPDFGDFRAYQTSYILLPQYQPNLPLTELTNNISSTQSSFEVNDGTKISASPGNLVIKESNDRFEVISYDSVTGNTVEGVIRGCFETRAQNFVSGTTLMEYKFLEGTLSWENNAWPLDPHRPYNYRAGIEIDTQNEEGFQTFKFYGDVRLVEGSTQLDFSDLDRGERFIDGSDLDDINGLIDRGKLKIGENIWEGWNDEEFENWVWEELDGWDFNFDFEQLTEKELKRLITNLSSYTVDDLTDYTREELKELLKSLLETITESQIDGLYSNPDTTLSTAIDDSQLTVPVVDPNQLNSAPNRAVIKVTEDKREMISYDNVSGNDLTDVIRGIEESDNFAFDDGTGVWKYGTDYNLLDELLRVIMGQPAGVFDDWSEREMKELAKFMLLDDYDYDFENEFPFDKWEDDMKAQLNVSIRDNTSIEVEYNENGPYKYMRDFNLGDVIIVEYENEFRALMRVIEVKEEEAESGKMFTLTLGRNFENLISKINKNRDKVSKRL